MSTSVSVGPVPPGSADSIGKQSPNSRSFSSLAIHGLLRTKTRPQNKRKSKVATSANLPPIHLTRAVTFPAKRCSDSPVHSLSVPVAWPALPQPPENGTELRIKLDAELGGGLTGIVHAVSLVDEHGNQLDDLPMGKLCVKLARGRYARSMAREAWFYEQLAQKEDYEGIVTPRYFGFFTVPLSDCARALGVPQDSLEVGPWVDSPSEEELLELDDSEEAEEEEEGARELWPLDSLMDDFTVGVGKFYEDDLKSRTNSPWVDWRGSRKDPLIGVLVLERLGRTYLSPEEEDEKGGSKKQRSGLHKLYKDISEAGIFHGDIRHLNILRWPKWPDMPERTNPICPRHKYAHQWRIVDFARSMMIVRHDKYERSYLNSQRECIGEGFFYGYD